MASFGDLFYTNRIIPVYPLIKTMPIYEYITENPEEACKVCGDGFELHRPIDRAPLKVCPICKKPVQKLISSVNTPKITKPLSVSDAKSAGFTVLEKRDEGTYEKL